MATMKEIAQICGVSRGTVDRVINRRGKVRPETERMILQAVERMGFDEIYDTSTSADLTVLEESNELAKRLGDNARKMAQLRAAEVIYRGMYDLMKK